MSRTLLSIAVVLALPVFAKDDDRPRVRPGGISTGFGYASGPSWPWWGMYDPFWSSGFLHSGLYRGFVQGPDMGQIKLQASKDASVYLDGAFAGTAATLKSIWLEPGIYDLQVVSSGGEEYRRKLYVLSGKTLNIKTGVRP